MIKNLSISILLVAMFIAFPTCASRTPIILHDGADRETIVVPQFAVRGSGLNSGTAFAAADQLTTLLFTNRNNPVIDRSQVNAWLLSQGIEQTYTFAPGSVVTMADTLNASVVVLGLIESTRIDRQWPEVRHRLSITLRMLSGKTGEVLKIVHGANEASTDAASMIGPLLKKLVTGI